MRLRCDRRDSLNRKQNGVFAKSDRNSDYFQEIQALSEPPDNLAGGVRKDYPNRNAEYGWLSTRKRGEVYLMKSYHNTTDITGRELDQYESKAKTQEERILEWFTFYEQAATPSRIHRLVLNDAPITSVRRAMTNLTKQGKLEQTPFKRRSPYGRPEYVWQLASPSPQHTLPWRSP